MRLWRITRARHQRLDGEGARLYGGRWSSEGSAVVYLASSLSLAALEYLVHVDVADVPQDLVALAVEVPDDTSIEAVDAATLPDGWRVIADHPACVAHGDAWMEAARSLLLQVPSAIVPHESNYLFNPAHSGAARARVASSTPFAFDPRLLG